MPSSSSSIDTDSPPPDRRHSEPGSVALQGVRPRTSSLNTKEPPGMDEKDKTKRKTMDKLNVSPHLQRYGIPLGTPAAKEAAKSFWTMDQLQESLEKIAQYTEQSPSTSSLGSSIESESLPSTCCVSTANSGLSTPVCSGRFLTLTTTQVTKSAPSSPLSSPRETPLPGKPSPLLHMATKQEKPTSLPSSPRLAVRSQQKDLRPLHGSSAQMYRHALQCSSNPPEGNDKTSLLSVEGQQITLQSRNKSSPTFNVSPLPTKLPLRSASYGGTESPDQGFHE